MANNYEKFPAEEWHPTHNDASVEGRYYEDVANSVWVCEKRASGEVISTEQAASIEEAYALFLVVLRS
jgi:hypothetical protein